MTDLAPVVGALAVVEVTTGLSNENADSWWPTIEPIESLTPRPSPVPELDERHLTELDVVHDVVEQYVVSIVIVGVALIVAKLSPRIVIDTPPDSAPFIPVPLDAGES